MPFFNENKWSKQSKAAFLTTLICGYIFHLYAFTNIIPNSDGISRVYDLQEMTVSGRWFLHFATIPHGFMQMPALIGALTLLFLALSCVLLVNLLKIQHPIYAVFLSVSVVTFPSLGFTFLYLFTASAYSIGVFLAILSVWFHEKSHKRPLYWGGAILSLACSMGVYQAYSAFAIALSVILVMAHILSSTSSFQSTLRYGLCKISYLTLGAGLYYALLHLILAVTGQELLPYLGMEESSYPFAALPSLIVSAYKQVILFFFRPSQGTSTLLLMGGNLLFISVGICFFLLLIKKQSEKEPWKAMALCCLGAILPLSVGFVQIISPWSQPTPLMQYSYVLVYVFILFVIDKAVLLFMIPQREKILSLVLCNIFVIGYGGGWLCNVLYTASAQAHRATESYVTRLVSRMEGTEEYQWGMPVLIIGAYPQDLFYADIESYSLIDHYSAPQHSVLPLNKHIYYYLNDWLNLPIPEPSEEEMIHMSESKVFQDMPCYPDDGSVAVIEGQMVVKIAPTYTPKSDYEIAYENRK